MQVNTEKSQIIVFRNNGILRNNEKWYLNGSELKTVTYYKYLGIFYSSRLNWSYGVNTLYIKSQRQ